MCWGLPPRSCLCQAWQKHPCCGTNGVETKWQHLFFFITIVPSVNHELRLDSDQLPPLSTRLSNKLINAAPRRSSWVLSVSVLLLFCHPGVCCTCQSQFVSKTVTLTHPSIHFQEPLLPELRVFGGLLEPNPAVIVGDAPDKSPVHRRAIVLYRFAN